MKLTPLAKATLAGLAEQIRQLSDAVTKLERADAQYRQLAAMDYAPRRNGHLTKTEAPPDDDHSP